MLGKKGPTKVSLIAGALLKFVIAAEESRKTQCFFLDPETIENQIIYFDPKKTSRIVIKKILNYYHHGEKCGKLLVGMSEKSKRVSEK